MTEDQISEFKEAFCLSDRKGSGVVDPSAMPDLLRYVGLNPTNAHLNEIKARIAGQPITFERFIELYKWLKPLTATNVDDIVRAFQVFDKDGNGFISAGELRYVLTSLGDRLEDKEVDELLKAVKVDASGMVQYHDLVKTIVSA